MKKYILYAVAGLLLFSCDSFLEEVPKTTISNENFLETEDDVNSAIYPVYRTLLLQGTYGRYWPIIDVGTDDVGTNSTANGQLGFANHALDGGQVFFDKSLVWDTWWTGINAANYVIDGLKTMDVDSVFMKSAEAEMRCMRAFYTFQLVRSWGDVPIMDYFVNSATYEKAKTEPRQPIDSVYKKLIIPDLVHASEHAPSVQAMTGRATKWLARTILAEVYATRAGQWRDSRTGEFKMASETERMRYWQNARDAAWSVISPTAGCPNSLVTEKTTTYPNPYAQNWERNFTKESLLEVGAIGKAGLGSWLTRECWIGINGGNFWGGTNARPFGGTATVNNMRFTGAANVGSFIPRPDLFQKMEPGDLRRWGLLTRYDEGTTIYLCQPAFRKYVDFRVATAKPGTSFQYAARNFVIYRYADALLLFAEADNELNGPTAEGIDAINKIRLRAGLAVLEASKTADKSAFRLAIRNERRFELHGECKRRFDLIRWGEFINATQNYSTAWLPADNPKPGGGSYMSGTSFIVGAPRAEANEKVHLFPIPLKEMNLHADWYDNKGYNKDFVE
ncbi:MAG: RagB/SusD family nutrient uptake outer membrane protein [Paludibacter sp.]|jgi:hypothetical protein|nr:RagB/SusD family nutrient uptake outer membrane protein [Paludibacter sp.]